MKFGRLCSADVEMANSLTDECTSECTDQETCLKFRNLKRGKGEQRQRLLSEFLDHLSQNSVSFQTKICLTREINTTCTKKTKQQNSVLKAILTLPEGCDIINNQLDRLVKINEEDEVIEVTLGPKTLFSPDEECSKFEQTRVIEEILSARNKMSGGARTPIGRSYNALTGLIKHPVMVVNILEKWDKVRDSFFLHLR